MISSKLRSGPNTRVYKRLEGLPRPESIAATVIAISRGPGSRICSWHVRRNGV